MTTLGVQIHGIRDNHWELLHVKDAYHQEREDQRVIGKLYVVSGELTRKFQRIVSFRQINDEKSSNGYLCKRIEIRL